MVLNDKEHLCQEPFSARNYAQLENDVYSLIFGVRKFHKYYMEDILI